MAHSCGCTLTVRPVKRVLGLRLSTTPVQRPGEISSHTSQRVQLFRGTFEGATSDSARGLDLPCSRHRHHEAGVAWLR
jgi:hypothetical protein